MTQLEFIKTFNSFPIKKRVELAKKIQLQVIDDLFEDISTDLPDINIDTEEIQKEIIGYRNDKKNKA
ncbi:MAG: hypothetical protein MUF45_15295 [Spirosomaceae bacterium]|jgi:hypothetical protein|nr:hypothetical protein [Spirosomataceae bacterium]